MQTRAAWTWHAGHRRATFSNRCTGWDQGIPLKIQNIFECKFNCKFSAQIIDIAAGGWHCAAISAFNDLYVWGWNVNGQLGLPLYKEIETTIDGDQARKDVQKKATVFASPVLLDLPKCGDEEDGGDGNELTESQYNPIEVFAGTRHTIVRTAEGTVLGSGWNKYKQLGSDCDCKEDQDKFVKLKTIESGLNDDFRIVCGEWSSMYFSIK